MLLCVCLGITLFKEAILGLFTSDQELLELAYKVIWLLSINSIPDGYKGMLNGVNRALGLQHKVIWISIFANWIIFVSLCGTLTFYLKWGMLGMWVSKCVLEMFLSTAYSTLVRTTNWE